MLVLYFCNGLIQLLPCYAPEQFLLQKNVLFLASGFSTLIIANVWAFFFADSEEFYLFAFRLLLSYFYITVGFIFFSTHFPERRYPDNRFVHLYLQSHILWHIAVHLGGVTLYWLLYDFRLYLEHLPKK